LDFNPIVKYKVHNLLFAGWCKSDDLGYKKPLDVTRTYLS